ncbi:MAG: YciI family protein [Sulfitobacter sp.]
MPAWDEYKTQAQGRGALAFELYVAMSLPAGAPDEVKKNLPDHLAYQAKLEQQGALFFAGPMSDETGTQMQGIGMIVYRAADFEEARALAEADPMHRSGARSYTLRKWLINEGSVSLSVGLSTRKVVLE